ncbi:hypothetical protein C8J57DRAFT_1521595 [Mycena rebaudengoi]|nr:hypothetical protein C8J57DRAFT_1521595 [Mycena rebaudengoi]
MHHCLQIHEIQDAICALLEPPPLLFSFRGNRDLVSLSITCRMFEDPALDVVWRSHDGMRSILRCMPEDLWAPETTGGSLEHFALRRAVAPADWERASKYLNRIRTWSIGANDLPSPSVFEALQVSFPADCFCPNVRDLRWLQPSSTQYIRSFFGPHITRIWISPRSLDHHSLLLGVATRYPNLTHLDISDFYFMRSDPELVKCVSALVRRLHHLQSLTVINLDTAAFVHIAHLGALKCLSLGDPGGFAAVIETGDAAYASRFPVLEDLGVETITPDFLLGLLESGPNRALHTLHVSFVRYPTLAETAQLYDSLAAQCSHSSLHHLHIEDAMEYQGPDQPTPELSEYDDYVVDSPTLRPLFVFHNLIVVELYSFFGFDLDDEIVVQMARAWPNIEKLNLLPKFDHHDSVDVTLDGLRAFAQYCPQLKTLGICVDATEPAPMSGTPISQRSLTQLDVGCSAIWRAKPVVAFIAAHFSEVDHVTASGHEYDPDDDGRTELWRAVDRKLEKMRTKTR